MLIKALMAAHVILLEDLRRISTGINQAIDLTEFTCESDVTKWFNSTPPADVERNNGEPTLQLSNVNAEVLNSANVNVSLFPPAFLCFRIMLI